MFFIALRLFLRCMFRSILASYYLSFSICVYFICSYQQLPLGNLSLASVIYSQFLILLFAKYFCVLYFQSFWKKEHKSENVSRYFEKPISLCVGVYFPLDCIYMNLFSQFLLKINCRQFPGNLSDRNKHTDICYFFKYISIATRNQEHLALIPQHIMIVFIALSCTVSSHHLGKLNL